MSRKTINFVLNLILLNFILVFADVIVEIPNGKILGRIDSTPNNKTFYSFQKVPFATPPLGDLRFKAPIPPKNWDGILNATGDNAICYQVTEELDAETEDCLYLNVFTPKLISTESELLPVFFFIYGGAYLSGDSLFYDYGPDYLIEEDVVVVTINYRVGPFGFLSTQDSVIPGNAGLKDQQLALKWTYKNIKFFGGDPEKITIAGHSAGAISVSYQLLNKKSDGLYRGAIGLSGSSICSYAYQRHAREIAFQTAAQINSTFHSSNDSKSLLDFLLKVPANDIDDASLAIVSVPNGSYKLLKSGAIYGPVIEVEHRDAFITEKMFGLFKTGNFFKVPTLIGIASEECIDLGFDLDVATFSQVIDDNLNYLVPDDMRIQSLQRQIKIGRRVKKIYVRHGNFSDNYGPLIRVCSDLALTHPIRKQAELQSNFADVYFYQFSYNGLLGNNTVYYKGAGRVGHVEILNYIFYLRDQYIDNTDLSIFPKKDILTQKRVLKLLTNFVKTLNPTPKPSKLLQNVAWPAIDLSSGNVAYLDINKDLTIRFNPKEETYVKFEEIYHSLGYDDFDTY